MKIVTLLLAFLCMCAPMIAEEGAKAPHSKADMEVKLKVVLPEVSFNQMPYSGCVAWLNSQGIPVEIAPQIQAATRDTRITLSLKNTPVIEVLNYLTNLTNTSFAIAGDKVIIGGRRP